MVHIPKKLVTVIGGRFNHDTDLRLSVEIHERLIVPTISFHNEDPILHMDQLVHFQMDGVGARVINCAFDFHQDIFEENPSDVRLESILDTPKRLEYFAEVAFMRSLKVIRCRIASGDRIGNLEVIFKKSPVKCVATNLGTHDYWMDHYVQSH